MHELQVSDYERFRLQREKGCWRSSLGFRKTIFQEVAILLASVLVPTSALAQQQTQLEARAMSLGCWKRLRVRMQLLRSPPRRHRWQMMPRAPWTS